MSGRGILGELAGKLDDGRVYDGDLVILGEAYQRRSAHFGLRMHH